MKKVLSFTCLCLFTLTQAGVVPRSPVATLEPLGFEKIGINELYAQRTEVSNADYWVFLTDLKSQGQEIDHLLPDTLVWREKLAYNEPYVEYYFRHPAYWRYPVVGVSYDQANVYCKWLSKKIGEWHHIKVIAKLPTEDEWMEAACANSGGFPWKGDSIYISLKEAKRMGLYKRHRGLDDFAGWFKPLEGEMPLCNVQERSKRYTLTYSADITALTESYLPNDLGLYNVCGNVREMLIEEGKAKGGSWETTAEEARIDAPASSYNKPTDDLGFRVFIQIEE
ncbi:MAG: SUMF1/EgtB/PvdO family nonheme iron enzyme [Flavobacteriales bacterium]|nr:SUMF1/EgtB/PvdO family nonheme iron enzyme [Flavobacteriales bacterium]